MNERIGKLLNRSGGAFYEGFLGSPNTIRFTEEEFETFAELIVRECIERVFVSIPDTMCAASGEYKTARLAAINSIKEHFGVE